MVGKRRNPNCLDAPGKVNRVQSEYSDLSTLTGFLVTYDPNIVQGTNVIALLKLLFDLYQKHRPRTASAYPLA